MPELIKCLRPDCQSAATHEVRHEPGCLWDEDANFYCEEHAHMEIEKLDKNSECEPRVCLIEPTDDPYPGNTPAALRWGEHTAYYVDIPS